VTTDISHSSTDSPPEKLPLLVLAGFARPRGVEPEKFYRAQLQSSDRLQGLRIVLYLAAILFIWGAFYPTADLSILSGWTAMALIMSFLPLRASRTRLAEEYAGVTGKSVIGHGVIAMLQALMWASALVLLGRHGTPPQVVALWTLTSCLMVGAAFAFAALPLSATAFLLPVGAGSIFMFHQGGSIPLQALVACYALVLLIASLSHARAFGRQHSTTTELAEKSAVVSLLLREYEDTGADWLWQTDAARRINGVSSRFAAMLGVQPEELEGKPLVQILAGNAWESGNFAPALHELAEKLKRRESFSGITIPVEVQGEIRWWELSASPRMDEKDAYMGFRGVGSDVTAQRESADKIAQLASFDALTDLPNRMQLADALSGALEGVERWNTRCAFLMIDLDRFKAVNDTLGHQVGDRLLQKVAERLRQVCSANEICGRIGGDEFAVVIREVADTHYVDQVAEAMIELLSRPYEVDQHTLYIGASIGSALAPRDGRTTETLIRSADLALYRAKEEGGGKHCHYEPKLHVHAEERRTLEVALREALEKDQLSVVYQPVVNAKTGDVEGFESLIRWTHPEMGPISPAKFIPVAEDARLIASIGEWVLRTACAEAMNWPGQVRIAVNVSAEQLGHPSFVATVMSALAQSGLPAHRLELEVTESVFMRDSNGATQVLEQILGLGVKLSLDDFGTGYSSLGYLSRTRFSTIKVDRSFVVGASKNVPESLAIVRAVVALAESLGMATTAEGVETELEVEMVNRLGCTKIQGYYFGRPMPADEARSLFRTGRVSAVA
jgi:diguanylate cyclase (GGDEF)-like protein/PAS domain S-box-containing protein